MSAHVSPHYNTDIVIPTALKKKKKKSKVLPETDVLAQVNYLT